MPLEASLNTVEQLLSKVSAAVLSASPTHLVEHSSALRDAAVAFARSLEHHAAGGRPIPAELNQRMIAVGEKLVLYRESLARLTAATDRQAAVLLPVTEAVTTYGNGLALPQAKPGVARIYRSAS